MGYHSSACDQQFSSKRQCCHNPIGRDGIPETSRQACVGAQWPAAGTRNTEMQRVRWREIILKHRERLPSHLSHEDQDTGITRPRFLPRMAHHTVYLASKKCFSWWTLLLSRGSEWCPQWAPPLRTPWQKTCCIKPRLMLNEGPAEVSASPQEHMPSLTWHTPAETQHGASHHLTLAKSTNPLVNSRQISDATQQGQLC